MVVGRISPRTRLKIEARRAARNRFWGQYDREGYECPDCGQSGVRFEVHHIDGDYLNNHMMNLIGLCHRCHKARHRRKRIERELTEWKSTVNELQ